MGHSCDSVNAGGEGRAGGGEDPRPARTHEHFTLKASFLQSLAAALPGAAAAAAEAQAPSGLPEGAETGTASSRQSQSGCAT
ncbi:unnamed protein product [Closterium sp. Naga37s-1]|nr:unnamed protein product [Closterium sp. Naga37s-1]